jgi:PAS domain S-box-containing protein
MSDLATAVKSNDVQKFLALSSKPELGRYLLDPRPVWLFTADGKHIVWANPSAIEILHIDTLQGLFAFGLDTTSATRRHIEHIALESKEQPKGRVEILRFASGGQSHACVCRPAFIDNVLYVVVIGSDTAKQLSFSDRARAVIDILSQTQPQLVAAIRDTNGHSLAITHRSSNTLATVAINALSEAIGKADGTLIETTINFQGPAKGTAIELSFDGQIYHLIVIEPRGNGQPQTASAPAPNSPIHTPSLHTPAPPSAPGMPSPNTSQPSQASANPGTPQKSARERLIERRLARQNRLRPATEANNPTKAENISSAPPIPQVPSMAMSQPAKQNAFSNEPISPQVLPEAKPEDDKKNGAPNQSISQDTNEHSAAPQPPKAMDEASTVRPARPAPTPSRVSEPSGTSQKAPSAPSQNISFGMGGWSMQGGVSSNYSSVSSSQPAPQKPVPRVQRETPKPSVSNQDSDLIPPRTSFPDDDIFAGLAANNKPAGFPDASIPSASPKEPEEETRAKIPDDSKRPSSPDVSLREEERDGAVFSEASEVRTPSGLDASSHLSVPDIEPSEEGAPDAAVEEKTEDTKITVESSAAETQANAILPKEEKNTAEAPLSKHPEEHEKHVQEQTQSGTAFFEKEHEAKPSSEKPIRFSWSVNRDGIITLVSPALEEALGETAGGLIGKDLRSIGVERGFDPEGQLATFAFSGERFSGLRLNWPLRDEKLSIPVVFSGMPVLDQDRHVIGMRGFGAIEKHNASPLEHPKDNAEHLPESEKKADTPSDSLFKPEEEKIESVEPEQTSLFNEDVKTEILPQEDALLSEDKSAAEQDIVTEATQIVSEPPSEAAKDITSYLSENVQEETKELPEDKPLSLSDPKIEDDKQPPSLIREVVSEDQRPKLRVVKEKSKSTKLKLVDVTEDDTQPEEPKKVENRKEQAADLTGAERLTLREIARRLGARIEDDDEDSSDKETKPEPSNENNAQQVGTSENSDTASQPDAMPKNAAPKLPTKVDVFEPLKAEAPVEKLNDHLEVTETEEEPEERVEPRFEDSDSDTIDLSDSLLEDELSDVEHTEADTLTPLIVHKTPRLSELSIGAPLSEKSDMLSDKPSQHGFLEKDILNRLPLGLIIYDNDTVYFANYAALDIAGLHNLEALQAIGGVEGLFIDGTLGGSNIASLRRADGSFVDVAARLQSIPWDGQSCYMLTLRESSPAQNTSDQKSWKARVDLLAERIGELEAILDTATDGVVVVDAEGIILAINRAGEALFGYDSEDITGRSFGLLFAEDSRNVALDYLEGVSKNGVASILNDGREVIGRAAQGGNVPLFMTLGRTSDTDDAKFCAVLRDITQWKRAEEDLLDAKRSAEKASSQKSDFLAKVSHEIRTPLNAIIGFSEIMLEERFGAVGSERYRGYLRDINTSGEHLMSILNDLLDLSKIEAGKFDFQFDAVDINDIIQKCVAIMQGQANRQRIILRTSLPTTVPNIVADARSMRQIILNLLSNAIKFTPGGGQVIVSTIYDPTGEVVIRVRDTGVGMSVKDINVALEPFRQIETTTRTGSGNTGTGLGLPLTKALVEANRASFTLESMLSEGTIIKIVFPPQRVLAE